VALADACEPAPSGQAASQTPTQAPSPSPPPTASPRPVPTATPPSGPDALACTERVTIPAIPDVIAVAWSPDGRTLAIDHMVVLPSAQITGSPEEFFLDSLDLVTGAMRPLGVGERQQWSASGKYLSYWSWDGELRIVIGGRVIDLPKATIPDVKWVGDTLYYFAKDELQSWTDGQVRTISHLPADTRPTMRASARTPNGSSSRATRSMARSVGTPARRAPVR